MTVRLSRGEYWILNLVSEVICPINSLFSDNIEELFNKAGHGMNHNEVLSVLLSLYEKELISMWQHNNHLPCLKVEYVRRYLEKNNTTQDWVTYQLTEKGGIVWEEFASPDWERYISTQYKPFENDLEIEIGKIECANRKVLDGYLQSLKFHDLDIVDGSIIYEELKPWEATYWKTLPAGYRIKFKCEWKKESNQPQTPEWLEQRWYDWR